MGAFNWSRAPKISNHTTIFFSSYGWEMKNLFSEDFHQTREVQNQTQQEIENTGVENEQERARCEWDFKLSAAVSSSTTGAVSDVLGVIEVDPSDSIVATSGIARKIRIYSINDASRVGVFNTSESSEETLLLDHATACDYYICTPAKLSSLRWRPGSGQRVIGSGDYDGVVTEYDLERRVPIFERDEHGGRRVWSMDYSHCDPVVGASGSDDGTMKLWDPRCDDGNCVATVQPSLSRSPVCCVEFNPFGGTLIAVGCADKRAYGYDFRMTREPLIVFDGHLKAVSYVRFLDMNTIISAGTDGCLKLWDLQDSHVIRTYRGHVNNRRFVGLSVWKSGGLIGCGSESNQVFVYDKRWGEPIWVHGLEPLEPVMSRAGLDEGGWISSVCWRQVGEGQCSLIAGRSDGVLQVFMGKRKSSSSDTNKVIRL
ncbi:WD repeat-containing protein RUP2-like isoform X2 [Tripterygium wilfordii]|uniref:WD repeat-containing protein RUP2-like isoform X2 n=1 Tax=Tripterygium wilfordii TaxID=458696 RepID=UPI0018F7FCBB|nr:WD repeat-containing protein RUP2-like isoform X2 [Tripterygium wilfordii]